MGFRHESKLTPLLACMGLLAGTILLSACQESSPGKWEPKEDFWRRGQTDRGEPWTILCLQTYGVEARATMDTLAGALRKVPNLRAGNVRLLHEEESSRLLYGTYYRVRDPEDGDWHLPADLRQDMNYIRQLAIGTTYPFLHCAPMPVEAGPVGPPEWSLIRQPFDYTLLVAVYSDIEERREAAVEHVKLLREQGEQAFYYHDASKSHVCVGLFSDADVKETGREVPVIQSPEYSAARKRHPYFIYNGQYISNVSRDAQGNIVSKTRQPTRLVRIPSGTRGIE